MDFLIKEGRGKDWKGMEGNIQNDFLGREYRSAN